LHRVNEPSAPSSAAANQTSPRRASQDWEANARSITDLAASPQP
jgi:hypothetical protein